MSPVVLCAQIALPAPLRTSPFIVMDVLPLPELVTMPPEPPLTVVPLSVVIVMLPPVEVALTPASVPVTESPMLMVVAPVSAEVTMPVALVRPDDALNVALTAPPATVLMLIVFDPHVVAEIPSAPVDVTALFSPFTPPISMFPAVWLELPPIAVIAVPFDVTLPIPVMVISLETPSTE